MRFARVHIFALLLSSLVVLPALGQESTPGVASVDNINSSMSLSSDGGTYMYFNKWAGDGVGVLNSYQQFGFRANLFDLDSYGSHIFSETHLYISDQSRIGYNLGGGVRWEYDTGYFGLNSFFDQTETVNGNTYRQVTVGAEYLHDGLDLLANGYFGVSDTTSHLVRVTDPNGPAFFEGNNIFTVGTGLVEKAYDGFDAEAGIPFPGLEPIRMYAGTYFLESDGGDETWGFRSRVQARVGQGTILNFIVSDDSTWGTNLNFQAQFMFWGESPLRTPYDYSAFSRRFDPVRRANVVQTQVCETDVNVPVINPRTNMPWTVYHIDNTAGAGVGTFEDRANMLPATTPEDLVLVYAGVGDTLGNISLIDHQQLLGEGKAHFIDTVDQGVIQLPDTFLDSGPFPTLRPTNAAMNIVTLANNNRIVGFNMVGSTAAAIGGTDVDNFWIECIHADSTNGVMITNASGMGVIRDSTFDANGAGSGVFVRAGGNGPLVLDIDDVDNTGGARGFDIVADGSDIDLTADNITGDMHSNAGFRIAADGSALTAVVNNADMTNSGRGFVQDVANGGSINSDFNNILATGTGNLFEGNVVGGGTLNTDVIGGTFSGSTAGNGIAFDLMGGLGQANFLNITANGNAIDGFNAVADVASNYNISIIDSTLIMNTDDSIDITSIGTSYVNVFYDPSDSSQNGDNGFEFLVDGGSELEAEFIDIDLSNNFNNAVAGVTMGGSTTTLDFTRVDMDDSTTGNALALIVDSGSTLNGTFLNSSMQRSGNDNIGIMVTNDSDATLTLTNTPADSSGRNGLLFLVDDGAMGASDLVVNVNNGTFDDNPMANIIGMVLDGSTADFNFNNVTADNMAAMGGMNVMVTNGGVFDSNWVGGSISNTMFNGVTGTAMSAVGAGTEISMVFDGVTIDNNDVSGIDLASTGPLASVVNLSLNNSPVTNNGLHGVTADLFNTTGTFTATNSPFTNNGTAGMGSGFRMFADGGSMMVANFAGSDANSNEEHGYHFNMQNSSSITSNFAGNMATATMNGMNGLNFEVLSMSDYTLTLTNSNFSNNGLAGMFSGVRGLVNGTGSTATVSFDGTQSNNNTLHGFEFLAESGGTLFSRLRSTGPFGNLSASDNDGNGVRFRATDAGTIASLHMSGDNQFNDNGLSGVFADTDALGVSIFGVQISGDLNNNGGDGAEVTIENVATAAVDITGNGTGTANDNMGHGINVNLTDSTLVDLGTPLGSISRFNISDFAGINDNGLNGINVFADNTDAPFTATINGQTTMGNTSGIVVDLTNGSSWDDLSISGNNASNNDVYGIHYAADSGTQGVDISGNTASLNLDTNILVEWSGTAGEAPGAEMHVDTNIVDGGLGTTVNEGIRVVLNDSAHLAPSSMDGNFVQDNGGHNIAFFMNDTSSVDDLTVDGNTSTGAGLDGIHIETASPVTLGGLSVSDSPEIGNNGDDGIEITLVNFFGDPDISIDDNINVHDNGNRGIALSLTDNTMGGPTSSAGAISISRNMVTNSLGGTGIEVTIDDQSGDMFPSLIVDSFTVTGTTSSMNAGAGLSLSATNSMVNTTLINESGFEDNMGGDGVLIFGMNSLYDTVTIDDNGMARNSGNGINLDLTGTPINMLDITNHQMGSSVNIGLDFLLDGNTFPMGMPMGTYTITNTSDPGLDITSFMFDIAGSGNIFDTSMGFGFPFTPFGGTEVTTGVTMVNGMVPPPFDTTVADNSTMINVDFNDFNPGESFQWDIDTDPDPMTQQQINGSDLVGSTILVNFTGGLFLQGALFPVGGNPDASQFVSTFSNNMPGGITDNMGSGIRISAQAGSHIGAMNIADNFITDNDLHGIDLIVDASNLPGMAAPATISGNEISGHVNGNGFNMVSPDTVTNDIGIDFTDNDITGNVIGTNIELDGSEILTTTISGNNVSMNTSFGSRFIGEDSSGFNATIGDSAGNMNTYDQNVDAGIAFELTDLTVSTITLENTTISGTTDGGNVNFDGDGLAIHTAMTATIDPLTIGNAGTTDTFFLGNEGSGLDILAIEGSQIHNMVVQNTSSNMNGEHGYSLQRFDNAHLGDPLIAPVMFINSSAMANTSGSGLDVFTTNATLQPVYVDIDGGLFDNNNVGMNFHAQGDSVLVVTARDFSASNNETDGVRVLTEQASTFGDVLASGGDPDPLAGAIQSTFLGAMVSGNGDNGFEFTAANTSRQSILIDENMMGTRTVVDGNTNDGIVYNGGGTTNSYIEIDNTDITNMNSVTTDDGIVIGLEGAAAAEVVIDDVAIGALIPSNIFPGLGGDGMNVSTSGSSNLNLTVSNSRIFNNEGDGYRGVHSGSSSMVGTFDNVSSRFNNARGFDIAVSAGGMGVVQDYTIMNSNASDNGDQGIFYGTRATADGSTSFLSLDQGPFTDITTPRDTTGMFDNVDASLNVFDSTITNNGQNVTAQGDGLVLAIGSNTHAVVNISGNTFGGNLLDDVRILPVRSVNPAASTDLAAGMLDTVVRDPTAHLDLAFGIQDLNMNGILETINGNTGDQINVTAAGSAQSWTFADGFTTTGQFTNADPFKPNPRTVVGRFQVVQTDGTSGFVLNDNIFTQFAVMQNMNTAFITLGGFTGRNLAVTPFPDGGFP